MEKVMNEKKFIDIEKKYWMDKLETIDVVEDIISMDLLSNENNIAEYVYPISQTVFKNIRDEFGKKELIKYILYLTALKIELCALYNKEESYIMAPVHEQGLKINNEFIILYDSLKASDSIKSVLNQVKNTVLDGFKNQHVDMDVLLQNINQKKVKKEQIQLSFLYNLLHTDEQCAKYKAIRDNQVVFEIEESDAVTKLKIMFNKSRLKESTVQTIARTYERILECIVKNRDLPINQISLVSKQDLEVYEKCNQNEAEFEKSETIISVFLNNVALYGNRIAIECGQESITYKELNVFSDKIACGLDRILRKNDSEHIGILMDKSIQMVACILAVLKVGKVYVPINTEYPVSKVQELIEDADITILFSSEAYDSKVEEVQKILEGQRKLIVLSKTDVEVFYELQDTFEYDKEKFVNSSAYMIYTSGTTGKSKGVLISNRNIMNLLRNTDSPYQFNCNDVWTMFHSYCFDFSVWEMYGALLFGGKLILISKEVSRDVVKFYSILMEKGVTVLNQTPGAFYKLIDIDKWSGNNRLALRYVIFGGETLRVQRIADFMKKYPMIKFVNMYGITETTVHVTYKFLSQENFYDVIPNIGKALPNYKTYIVNCERQLLPCGISGELVVLGEGVANGYFNRKDLNEKSFSKLSFERDKTAYYSGDLAKIDKNGDLFYMGRLDQQVKIRGHRIELGEVKYAIEKNPEIKDLALTTITSEDGEVELCCYYCAEKPITINCLKQFLSDKIASYSIPSYFVYVDQIILNKNGKVDFSALPSPKENVCLETEYEAPVTQMEKLLHELWCNVLNVEKIGVNDDFFAVGGHSLNAINIIMGLEKKENILLSINDFFANTTIRTQAKYIEEQGNTRKFVIPKAEKKEKYEMTSAQKRMYYLYEMNKESLSYNMPIALKAIGSLDFNKMKSALYNMSKHQVSLRTSFQRIEGDLYQVIGEVPKIDFQIIPLSSTENIEHVMKQHITAFHLEKYPLMRIKVFQIYDDEHYILFDMHHIISDGVSISVIIEEFLKFYANLTVEELKIDYIDYSEWIKDRNLSEMKEYWIKQLQCKNYGTELPLDYKRTNRKSDKGDNIKIHFGSEEKRKIKEFCNRYKCSEYMFFMSILSIMLSKYTRNTQVVIGSPVTGRVFEELNRIVGLYVNTVAILFDVDRTYTYVEYLEKTKEKCIQALENQEYPFDELVKELNIGTEAFRNPVFDILFAMQNIEQKNFEIEGVTFESLDLQQDTTKFDISFILMENKDEYIMMIQYSSELFKEDTVKRYGKHYIDLIHKVMEDPEKKISEISLIDKIEEDIILHQYNNTDLELDNFTNVISRFESQVQNTPDNIAISYMDINLTYRQFNNLKNQIAGYLIEKGVQIGDYVAVMMNRSIEQVVAVYGILKAGAAYVPIDKNFPEKRKEILLQESGAKIVLTDELENEQYGEYTEHVFVDLETIKQMPTIQNYPIVKEHDVAYMIFTSGTTGNPKGVEVLHRNVYSLVYSMQYRCPLIETDAFLYKAAFSFDASIGELFGWFFEGGKLVILESGKESDSESIAKTIEREHVTHVNFVPAMLRIFLCELKQKKHYGLSSLKYIFAGGEVFKEELFELGKEVCPHVQIGNFYGPTETTVYATGFFQNGRDYVNVPIGKPIDNVKILIQNKEGQLCCIGEPGELCIYGNGVSRGYKNNLELSNERFIPCKFYSQGNMYRTGDLARWLPDGNIEFIGRIDVQGQVKIRGFRIELREIEIVLKSFKKVQDAVVVVKEDEKGDKYLCAYFVSSEVINTSDIKRWLRSQIPGYMIPSFITQVDYIPLTVNQKVDYDVLKKYNDGKEHILYQAPRNDVERKVAKLFEELLSIGQVNVTDNFFELGGHSLKLIELKNKLNYDFGVELTLVETMNDCSVEGLAKKIVDKSTKDCKPMPILPTEEMEYYPATDEQIDMFLSYLLQPEGLAFNIPMMLQIKGNMDKILFEKSIQCVIEKYEILRSNYLMIGGEVVQKINENGKFKLEYEKINMSQLADTIENFIKPFSLETDSLVRIKLLETAANEYVLLADVHHIILDGMSLEIVINQILMEYQQIEQTYETLQFKDYAVYRNANKRTSEAKNKEYWKKHIDSEIPILELETVYPRRESVSQNGDHILFILDEDIKRNIELFTRENECTFFQFMMTVYYVTLVEFSGQLDIVIGAVITGRDLEEIKNMVGLFIKTLPIRCQGTETMTEKELLSYFKEIILSAIDHQNISFQEIVRQSGFVTLPGHRPIFDVAMVVQNDQPSDFKIDDMEISGMEFEHNSSKYDLFLEVRNISNGIQLKLEYCTELFDEVYVREFGNEFLANLKDFLSGDEFVLGEKIGCKLSNQEMNNFEGMELSMDFTL